MQIIEFWPQGFSANCYALVDGEDIALIDVGTANTEIIDFVKKNSNNLKYILLTHDHFDHIGGVEEVLKHCSAKVCIHKNDVSGLIDSTFSLCNMAGVRQPSVAPDITLNGGEELPFGNTKIKVLHTPGHTDGCVCYLVDDILFSGDTLFFESVGRTDFITGDSVQLQNSLKKIIALKGVSKVYTGHGEPTTLEHERKHNFFINYENIY